MRRDERDELAEVHRRSLAPTVWATMVEGEDDVLVFAIPMVCVGGALHFEFVADSKAAPLPVRLEFRED